MAVAEQAGGARIAPNGLPIACVRADGTLLEHAHADHPTYVFPVTVEYVWVRKPLPEWDDSYQPQAHALVWTDGAAVVTLYECSYSLWALSDGERLGAPRFGRWRLTDESIRRIRAWLTRSV